MLVRDVAKRYTMVNIMNHKWVNDMDEEDKASVLISDSIDPELSEEVLTMMLARGIDREKTIQVRRLLKHLNPNSSLSENSPKSETQKY